MAEDDIALMYDSRFLNCLNYAEGPLTIASVYSEKLTVPNSKREPVQRPIIRFKEIERELSTNKVNREALQEKLGRHTSQWIGAVIEFYVDKQVKLGPKTVSGLRIKSITPPTRPDDSEFSRALVAIEKDPGKLEKILKAQQTKGKSSFLCSVHLK